MEIFSSHDFHVFCLHEFKLCLNRTENAWNINAVFGDSTLRGPTEKKNKERNRNFC